MKVHVVMLRTRQCDISVDEVHTSAEAARARMEALLEPGQRVTRQEVAEAWVVIRPVFQQSP